MRDRERKRERKRERERERERVRERERERETERERTNKYYVVLYKRKKYNDNTINRTEQEENTCTETDACITHGHHLQ